MPLGESNRPALAKRISVRWPKFRAAAIALAAAICLSACEPLFIFPGGELAGDAVPPPESWEFSRDVETVQLETRPTAPYSVNVWGVHAGADFYVAASDGAGSRWAQAIEADPLVRLKVGDKLFALTATRIGEDPDADSAEMTQVVNAYVEKYSVGTEDNFVASAWVYRLQPR